jgi:hypothetical protein
MTVYVNDVEHRFHGMTMNRMWADSIDELLTMATKIGVNHRWLRQPPIASWTHFDITINKKELAVNYGAILTDKYGPSEHVAKLVGDTDMLGKIAKCRVL